MILKFNHKDTKTRRKGMFPWCLGVLVVLSICAEVEGFASDRLVGIDGQTVEATVLAIDPAGIIRLQSGSDAKNLQDLRRIERPSVAATERPAGCELFLAAGGVVRAEQVGLENETWTVRWAFGDHQAMPLAAIRAVRFSAVGEGKNVCPAFDESRAATQLARDELFAVVEKSIQTVRGALAAIGSEEVRFVYENAERKIRREKVYGISLAQPGTTFDPLGTVLVHLNDGSSLAGTPLALENNRLAVRLACGATLELPWDAVRRIDVRSSRVAFLSDLAPVAAVQETIVTEPMPWRRDQNVLGGPMILGGTTYDKGLGVHARAKLTFEPAGKFAAFAATIGLDAAAEGRGHCEFIVEADGHEIFRRAMRGTDPPEPIRLPIAGVKRVILTVDYGEDLDLADRADWADARFLKEDKR